MTGEHRSIGTFKPAPPNDLHVSNARDNRVVDLEGNSDTKTTPAVSADHIDLLSTHLYSTPSLIESGFFFKSSSFALSLRLKMIFLPGGRVGESSSKVNTVTCQQRSVSFHRTWLKDYAHLGAAGIPRSSRDDAQTSLPTGQTLIISIQLCILIRALGRAGLVSYRVVGEILPQGSSLGMTTAPWVKVGFKSSSS